MDLQHICQQTIQLTEKVADFIRTERKSFTAAAIEQKGHSSDLVSYVDKQAEEQLVAQLRQILPEAGFITEEGTATHQSDAYNWIVDPLDGTTNFLHGLPVFSVSVGLLYQNQPVMGVVYDVSNRECFSAWKNGGAYCNGKRIQTSVCQELKHSLIATGFPYYEFSRTKEYLAILEQLMQRSRGIRRLGSAAIDMAYVACGRFDSYFEFNINSYDIAAGVAVLLEAGGSISDFYGGQDYLFGRSVIASSTPAIHDELLSLIKTYWK